jgi:hypothetical protein
MGIVMGSATAINRDSGSRYRDRDSKGKDSKDRDSRTGIAEK